MNRFRKILVGVDLSTEQRLVCTGPHGPSEEAVKSALWLARETQAAVHFLYSLDAAAATERLIGEHRGDQANIFDEATAALAGLVRRAEAVGIEATSAVSMGVSWIQLIRKSITGDHDLVIVGTHGGGLLKRALIGSTAMKLLRKCPCPVWVTKPKGPDAHHGVLVAHDLTDVGRQALELGASMSRLTREPLHIVHAVPLEHIGERFPTSIDHTLLNQRKNEALRELTAQAGQIGLATYPDLHVVIDRPGDAILNMIERHQIGLVVMGTVARTGIRGFVMGNTAERVMPAADCSLLAVKPEGFECPVDVFQLD